VLQLHGEGVHGLGTVHHDVESQGAPSRLGRRRWIETYADSLAALLGVGRSGCIRWNVRRRLGLWLRRTRLSLGLGLSALSRAWQRGGQGGGGRRRWGSRLFGNQPASTAARRRLLLLLLLLLLRWFGGAPQFNRGAATHVQRFQVQGGK